MNDDVKDLISEMDRKYLEITTRMLYYQAGSLEQKCDYLEEIIDKAIEYIKQHCEIVKNLKENTDKIGKVEGIPLLNILEGSDKECK